MRKRSPKLEKISALINYNPRCSLEETLNRVIEYEKQTLQ